MRVAALRGQLYLANELHLHSLVLHLFAWDVGHLHLCMLDGADTSACACSSTRGMGQSQEVQWRCMQACEARVRNSSADMFHQCSE